MGSIRIPRKSNKTNGEIFSNRNKGWGPRIRFFPCFAWRILSDAGCGRRRGRPAQAEARCGFGFFLADQPQHPGSNWGRGEPAPLRGRRSNFGSETRASFSRLELSGRLSFLWVTLVSNRSASRLEFWSLGTLGRPEPGILGRRSMNRGPNREMLPLPALVPGSFICSSNRFGAVPFPPSRDQGKSAAQMGRPRARTTSNCVIILKLYLRRVNGTKGRKLAARGRNPHPHKSTVAQAARRSGVIELLSGLPSRQHAIIARRGRLHEGYSNSDPENKCDSSW